MRYDKILENRIAMIYCRQKNHPSGNLGYIRYETRSHTGKITSSLLLFALPMTAGNLLQQFYNIADTLIVGRVLGRDALAAVGSAYTLMVFLTSVLIGLCMGQRRQFFHQFRREGQ